MKALTATVSNLRRSDGWFSGVVTFSHGVTLDFFVTPSGGEVRFYRGTGEGGVGGRHAAPHRRALLVALGLPADAAGDPEPQRVKRRAPELPHQPRAPKVSMSRIAREVADRYRLSVEDLRGDRRLGYIIPARQEAMYLMREGGRSTVEIGRFFRRDHATVIAGSRRHLARIAEQTLAVAA